MDNKKIALLAGRNAAGVLVYVLLVGTLLINGNRLFGSTNALLGIMAFLLLFVLSAAVTGLLILGQPASLYLRGDRPEGIRLLLFTVGWLFVLVSLALATAAIFSLK